MNSEINNLDNGLDYQELQQSTWPTCQEDLALSSQNLSQQNRTQEVASNRLRHIKDHLGPLKQIDKDLSSSQAREEMDAQKVSIRLKTMAGHLAPEPQPWYQRIRSMVSQKTAKFVIGSAAINEVEKDLYRGFKQLIRSGTHTSSFVYQFFDEETILAMPSIAIIAAYLKQKHQLNNLYVCHSLKAFQQKLIEIKALPEDGRYAFIVSNFDEDDDLDDLDDWDELIDDSIHKVAVCVEKTGSMVQLAVLDSLGSEDSPICPNRLFSDAIKYASMSLETILRYVCEVLNPDHTALYYSAVRRQKLSYGCETFALKDALFFLRDPKFFEKIEAKEKKFKESESGKTYVLREIHTLPPQFMKGVQSPEILNDYYTKHPQDQEIEQLKQHIQKHTIKIKNRSQNYYIDRQSLKYHLFALAALQTMKEEELQQVIEGTLLREYQPINFLPFQTSSDLSLPWDWDIQKTAVCFLAFMSAFLVSMRLIISRMQ